MKLDYEHIVSKTKELMELKNLGLTINEYKILDIYLSKINPKDESTARVSFTLNEYCKIMNVTSYQVRSEQIHAYLKHLFDNSITERLNNEEFKLHHLFDEAHYEPVEKKIYIECAKNTYVRKMFFDIDNFQYIKYRLKNTILLKSVYSIKLYLYLLDNKFRKKWEMDLDDLKEILEVNSDYYNDFKNLNRKILKKSISEINDVTDIIVEYTLVRVGKKVGKIQFNINSKQNFNEYREGLENNEDMISEEEQNREYFLSTERPIGIYLDFNTLYDVGGLSYIPEFNYDKLIYLYSMIILMPEVKLKAEQIRVYHLEEQRENPQQSVYPYAERAVGEYISKKIFEIKTRTGIKNKYSYLLAMIQADLKKLEG